MNSKDIIQKSLMIEVSTLYYEQNMTQLEIAKKVNISRAKVSRLLTKAREQGIVEIKVNHLLSRNYYLENHVKEKFWLKEVLLYDNAEKSKEDTIENVTKMAGEYLEQRINEQMVVGISWGNTISKTIESISNVSNQTISVVEIMGFAATINPKTNGNNMANKLATKYNGYVYNMNSPLFVDLDVKEKLQKDPIVSNTLSRANNADLIITSLGILDFEPNSSPWTEYMTNEMLKELKVQGAVGSIGARFFDINGNILKNEWDKHLIGINLEDIRNANEVVVVAEGEKKSNAILGALRGGFVDVLISDSYSISRFLYSGIE